MASVFVYLDHLGSPPFTDGLVPRPIASLGSVAVILFFVLSGYVIGFVSIVREKSIAQYSAARLARMYSVALPCLFLTLTFDSLGVLCNPQFYEIKKVMWHPPSWEGYMSALFFVNEFQIFSFGGVSPGSNAPYWSLSFEAAYYIVAGAVLYCSRRAAFAVTVVVIVTAGATIAVLLPCWWLGYLAYRSEVSVRSRKLIWLFALLSLALSLAAPLLAKIFPQDNFGFSFPWGRGPFERNVVKDYLIAIPFALHLAFAKRFFEGLHWTVSPSWRSIIRRLGEYTFPLYLVHFPVLAFFSSLSPWSAASPLRAAYLSIAVVVVVWVVSPLCERLKFILKNFFARFLDPIGKRHSI